MIDKCKAYLDRKVPIPEHNALVKKLAEITKIRNTWIHYKPGERRPTREELIDTQDSMIDVVQILREQEIYPNVIRIDQEIVGKYGTKSYRALDDRKREWMITKPNFQFATDRPYYLFSLTNPIAVDPLIIERN